MNDANSVPAISVFAVRTLKLTNIYFLIFSTENILIFVKIEQTLQSESKTIINGTKTKIDIWPSQDKKLRCLVLTVPVIQIIINV